MTYQELANLILPDAKDIAYYEEFYPVRKLPEGAVVTRFAPSPTGFVHIGGLLQCIVEKTLVSQTKGVLLLRIEDTDQKRKVENGIENIVTALRDFDIVFDEGMKNEEESFGPYGPYVQSARKEIYEAYVKHLLANGRAYPCFATETDLSDMREKQKEQKATPGYYGEWALYRNYSLEEAARRIRNGENYVIRFRSMGDPLKTVVLHDLVRGNITFQQNEMDIVILKQDGLPTYHMAHVVDDHLMHTTHVIRSDEWVSSAPIHLELFEAFGWSPPHYCHYSPMLKEEDGKKRKISKRKDPEAAVSYYHQIGVPNDAVKEYLMGVANSAFEDWRKENPNADLHTFPFRLDRMSISGALFDMNKLIDISKNLISTMSPDALCAEYVAWLEKYDTDTLSMMNDREYMRRIFSIERDEKGTKRKDYYCWSEVREQIEFLFDECFSPAEYPFQKINNAGTLKKVFDAFKEVYVSEDDSSIWFEKMKDIAESIGYARDFKTWKKNQETYDGHVGDVCAAFRVALTGRTNAPDLYSVMQVLGKDRVFMRLDEALQRL